ncbi:MAG: ASPIC/UnbV domain-containing protein, partial [Acidobacteriota bacterium]
ANSTPLLFRNNLPLDGHRNWVEFLLEGVKSNRDAVGAQMRLTAGGRTQLSFVNGGNGFASQSTHRLHFGLADNREIQKVEIRWPSGQIQTFQNLAANRIYRIKENEGIKNFE